MLWALLEKRFDDLTCQSRHANVSDVTSLVTHSVLVYIGNVVTTVVEPLERRDLPSVG